ncbi:MAG TPA: type 4a pilus biogenesis protein PilO [Acidimicrobiales bacterium]
MEKVKRFRIPVFIGMGALAFALIVYAAWISPEGSKLTKLKAQQSTLQAQQTALQIRIATLKKEKSQLGPDCQELTTDLTEIPGTPDVDSFLKQVSALAVSSGDPSTPNIDVTQATGTTATAGVTPVTVALTLEGTYGQMTSFLEGLDNFPRLFTVTSISVTGGSVVTGGQAVAPGTAGYTLTMSGDIFYSTGQKNACGAAGSTSA